MDARGEAAGRETAELDRLFLAFLEASERGHDAENELLERAGPLGARLVERIRVHRDLAALSQDLGLAKARPQRIGRFEVVRLVGAGGISRVYEAHDPRLGRTVALKVLDRKGLLDRSERAWALNEGRSLARIAHRNVARVYDVGEIDDEPYVAMELLPGPSLERVIARWRRERDGTAAADGAGERAAALAARYAPFSARIGLLEALAGALAHCHDHGILHRDVKPANVLFDADGEPRLIDFGLAHVEGADEDSRLGLTQALVGTAAYIAPEQVTRDATGADPKSDQFSLGTLGYELFALENPFHRPSRHAILAAVEAADPPPLATRARALPPDLARVIHHALAKEPGARYPDLAAFAADLRAIREHRPVSVAEPSLAALARLWMRRHARSVRLAAALGVLVAVAAAALWSLGAFRERARLAGRIAAFDPAALTEREHFGAAYVRMEDLEDEVRAFDASWLRRRLCGSLGGELGSAVLALSRRLGDFARTDPLLTDTGPPTPVEGTYEVLFQLDEALCPGDHNDPFRRRGRVRYPQDEGLELALFRLGIDPTPGLRGLSRLEPVPLAERLPRGLYRLRAWTRGSDRVRSEIEFTCDGGWKAPLDLAFRPPDPELLRATRAFARGTVPTDQGTLELPDFRILDHLVTVAEFTRFLQATGGAPLTVPPRFDVPLDAHAPAPASLVAIEAFARWVGARLPTVLELELAGAADGSLPRGLRAVGEYVSDPSPHDGFARMWLEYDDDGPFRDRLRPVIDPSGFLPGVSRKTGVEGAIGFRLVFSDARVNAPE